MAVAFDATATGNSGAVGATSLTYSHTCTGANRVLVVSVSWLSTQTVSGVTYNTVAMVATQAATTQGTGNVQQFILFAPATGAHNVVITMSASTNIIGNSVSLTGANQSNTPDNVANNVAAAATSVTKAIVSVADNSFIVDGVTMQGVATGPTAGGSQTQDQSSGISASMASGTSHRGPITPAGSTSNSWNHGVITGDWSYQLVTIAPPATASLPRGISVRQAVNRASTY